MSDKESSPYEIWLEPEYVHQCDRTWCDQDVYDASEYDGNSSVKYIRADIYENLLLENRKLKGNGGYI